MEEKVITNVHTILYWLDKNDILGAPRENPASDSQFNHWEIPVQNWWTQNKGKYNITSWNDKPTIIDNVHTDSSKPVISITEPNNHTNYSPNQKINIKVLNSSRYPLTKIDVFINDTYLGTYNPIMSFSFIPKELEDLREDNEIRLVAHDSVYGSSETTSTFKVE